MDEYIGKKYNKLTIFKKDDFKTAQYNQPYYFCQCECGNIVSVRLSNLIYNGVKSCGCIRFKNDKYIGQRFNMLTILSRNIERTLEKKKTYYNVQCDCGNIVIMRGDNIFNGHNHSCGCMNHKANIKDMLGQIVGCWEIIEQIPSPAWDTTTGAWWRCKCVKCGEEKIYKGKHLLLDRVARCSLDRGSNGEIKIRTLLQENNLTFKEQYVIPELKSVSRHSLYFDFAIFKNNSIQSLIEYQGQQHYEPVEYFGGTEHFLKQQKNDELKRQYCLEHNIPLIEIPYTHYNNLSLKDLLIETSLFLTRGG